MKRKISTIMSIVLCITLLFSYSVQADTEDKKPEIHKILQQWQDGINSKDVEKYLSVFDDNMRDISEQNIKTANEDEKKYLRFYAVKNLKYGDVKKVSLNDIHYYDIGSSNIDSAEVYYFYFDTELYDNMETTYTKNGRNFAFCILTKQGNNWKISQFSVADVASFITKGVDLGTSEEARIESDIKERKMKIEKLKGINKNIDLTAENIGIMTAIPAPTTVRVCCRSTLKYNNKTNYEYWNVSKGKAAKVPYDDYIKDVLPNEWDSDKIVPDSKDSSKNLKYALYSGALMVKTFSWYMTKHPWDGEHGFDVNDDSTQCYLHDTRSKQSADGKGVKFAWGQMCTNAFNTYGEVSNYIIYDWDKDEPLEAHYYQTQQDRSYYLDKTLGYATYGIIRDIYETMYPKKIFSLRDYTN